MPAVVFPQCSLRSRLARQGAGERTLAQATVESWPSASASWLPSDSSELVHRHRLARAATAPAPPRASQPCRHAARRFVLSLLDVRRDDVSFGPTPDVTDGGAHRLGRDPLIAPLLGYPPARLDLVRLDPIDAISSQAQLGAPKKALVSQIPNRPGAELAP